MRVYATDDRGQRFLRHIECDHPGCDRKTAPGSSELLDGGWVKRGVGDTGDWSEEYDLCPDHANVPLSVRTPSGDLVHVP